MAKILMVSNDPEMVDRAYRIITEANDTAYHSWAQVRRLHRRLDVLPNGLEAASTVNLLRAIGLRQPGQHRR
jgi:hypothetical protein